MAGLYVHIPFCASRCAYCDFYSASGRGELLSAYPEALMCEMELRRNFFARSPLFTLHSSPSTIYVGGGTPSQLAPEVLQGLLDRAAEVWDCSGLREVTLEANPEDLTDDYIARLSGTGFNRISIGIQSFDDGLLRLMNRRHSAGRVRQAVRAAQRAGFDNISVDLIFGIPGMTRAQWERSLDEAIGLGVQHVSAYHLTIEPGTAFGKMNLSQVPEAESEWQYEMLRRKLGDAGFEHYEISNFALPGRRAVHNGAYWSGEPYLGLGPSAHSYDGARRREWVLPDVEKYIAAMGHIPDGMRKEQEHSPSTDRYSLWEFARNDILAMKPAPANSLPPLRPTDRYSLREFPRNDILVMKSAPANSLPPLRPTERYSLREFARNDILAMKPAPANSLPPLRPTERYSLWECFYSSAGIYEGETLSDAEFYNERIMTSLRTAEGVKSEELRVKSDKNMERFLADGLLVRRGERIAIPPEKFLMSDYIISSLFVAEI